MDDELADLGGGTTTLEKYPAPEFQDLYDGLKSFWQGMEHYEEP